MFSCIFINFHISGMKGIFKKLLYYEEIMFKPLKTKPTRVLQWSKSTPHSVNKTGANVRLTFKLNSILTFFFLCQKRKGGDEIDQTYLDKRSIRWYEDGKDQDDEENDDDDDRNNGKQP